MKIPSQTKSKSKIIGITLALLIIAAGAYAALAHSNNWFPFANEQPSNNVNTVDLEPPTDEQVQTGNNIKRESIEAENTNPPTGAVDVSITAANQNGDTLQVRVLIASLGTNGSCALTLSRDSKVVTRSAPVQALSSSSTCQGFDIPTSELSPGKWAIKVEVTSGTTTGSVTSEVVINET